MNEQTLVPKLNPGFIIPLTKDQLDRSELTLKELRELAKAKGISILGPKGGYLTKQPLLKKVEEAVDFTRYLKDGGLVSFEEMLEY